jgi:hypothetical protein
MYTIAQVQIPASAHVGIWRCNIQTNRTGRRDARNDFLCEGDIYVLFNPWCKGEADNVSLHWQTLSKSFFQFTSHLE